MPLNTMYVNAGIDRSKQKFPRIQRLFYALLSVERNENEKITMPKDIF